jgi:L-aminopeptidase/D-esterase-like protein
MAVTATDTLAAARDVAVAAADVLAGADLIAGTDGRRGGKLRIDYVAGAELPGYHPFDLSADDCLAAFAFLNEEGFHSRLIDAVPVDDDLDLGLGQR